MSPENYHYIQAQQVVARSAPRPRSPEEPSSPDEEAIKAEYERQRKEISDATREKIYGGAPAPMPAHTPMDAPTKPRETPLPARAPAPLPARAPAPMSVAPVPTDASSKPREAPGTPRIDYEIHGEILSLKNLPAGTKISIRTDISYPLNDPANIPLSNGGMLTLALPDGNVMNADVSKRPITFVETLQAPRDSLAQWLRGIGAVDGEWRVYRDRRLAGERVQVESAYISWEAAIYYINSGDFKRAETILASAVESALKNGGKLPRLYYRDGTSEGVAATNGDASTVSIALWEYLDATKGLWNTDFRIRAGQANEQIQRWLKGLRSVGDPAFVTMSDDNPLMDGIKTEWTTSVSVENNARRIMSLYHTDRNEWKRQLQKLIDASWDGASKQFASGIDVKTLGPTKEYARDAFSLLVLAADKYGLMTAENRSKFTEAARVRPAFSLEDGTFWYSQDHHPSQTSAIPEFMYMDVAALRVLGLDNIAKKHYELAEKSNRELGGGYSTEYRNENPNSINVIMKQNVIAQKNYYA